jgi:hypothetical protein
MAAALAHGPEMPPLAPVVQTPPLNVLVLSGGGKFSAFSAGVLVGWTESGTRPTFDVVTGISSGALEATLAFLGPKYDHVLRECFSMTRTSDLFSIRPLYHLLTKGSLASADRLERRLGVVLDEPLLADLREAHASGRRLFIGTCNLRTKRLVVWDVGAIASSGKPDAAKLIRKILVAACSMPGLVPPVRIEVEVNGKRYIEEHSDGGTAAVAFLRFGPLAAWPPPGSPCHGWLTDSNLYVLAAGKLYSDPVCGKMGLFQDIQAAVSSGLHAVHRGDLRHLRTFCAVSGMKYHLVSMPADVDVESTTMTFKPAELERMYEIGRKMSAQGICWRHTPPGGELEEEDVPRAGVSFTTLPNNGCPPSAPVSIPRESLGAE